MTESLSLYGYEIEDEEGAKEAKQFAADFGFGDPGFVYDLLKVLEGDLSVPSVAIVGERADELSNYNGEPERRYDYVNILGNRLTLIDKLAKSKFVHVAKQKYGELPEFKEFFFVLFREIAPSVQCISCSVCQFQDLCDFAKKVPIPDSAYLKTSIAGVHKTFTDFVRKDPKGLAKLVHADCPNPPFSFEDRVASILEALDQMMEEDSDAAIDMKGEMPETDNPFNDDDADGEDEGGEFNQLRRRTYTIKPQEDGPVARFGKSPESVLNFYRRMNYRHLKLLLIGGKLGDAMVDSIKTDLDDGKVPDDFDERPLTDIQQMPELRKSDLSREDDNLDLSAFSGDLVYIQNKEETPRKSLFYFLIDVSGSMTGEAWKGMCCHDIASAVAVALMRRQKVDTGLFFCRLFSYQPTGVFVCDNDIRFKLMTRKMVMCEYNGSATAIHNSVVAATEDIALGREHNKLKSADLVIITDGENNVPIVANLTTMDVYRKAAEVCSVHYLAVGGADIPHEIKEFLTSFQQLDSPKGLVQWASEVEPSE